MDLTRLPQLGTSQSARLRRERLQHAAHDALVATPDDHVLPNPVPHGPPPFPPDARRPSHSASARRGTSTRRPTRTTTHRPLATSPRAVRTLSPANAAASRTESTPSAHAAAPGGDSGT